jgi:predicted nucleic acid-binding protein
MSAFFFDISSIVKRYVQETGTAWVQQTVDPAARHLIYVARISAVEVTSAVVRRQQGGSLLPAQAAAILSQFRHDLLAEYRIVEVTVGLLRRAITLAETYALRAYDAVQLAGALELHTQRTANSLPALTLVSSDQELNAAASAEGFLVEDPNLHP